MKKKKITLTQKLWILCGALLTQMLIVAVLGIWNLNLVAEELHDARDVDLPAIRSTTLVDMLHDGIRANVFHAIISSGTKDQNEIKEVRGESIEFAKNIKKYLEDLGKLQLGQAVKHSIGAVAPKLDGYVLSAQEIVEQALAGDAEKAMNAIPAFQEKFEALEKDLEVLGELIEKDSADSAERSQVVTKRSFTISMALVLFGLIFGMLLSTATITSLTRTLREVITGLAQESRQVATTADSLTSAAVGLERSTTQQASALQETAASVDEITAMVKKTEENSVQLKDTAQTSRESAVKGQDAIQQMLVAMGTIRESNSQIMTQVEGGNQKIAEIVKVISEIETKTKVINDIVFQTKLLSFNASVEAARAGEHGKGFAVVAEEVGNLAQMSGNAAKEISSMLSSSIEKVNAIVQDSRSSVEGLIADGKTKLDFGSEVAQQCGSTLEQIVKQASEVGTMVTEIATAIQEQTQGIQEISKAIDLLDRSTHENSNTSKATAANSTSLQGQSRTLGDIVGVLEAMVGTGTASVQPTEEVTHQDEEPSQITTTNKAA